MIPSWLGSLVLVAALAAPAVARGGIEQIDAQRWRSRLLVVIAPSSGDARTNEQKRLLQAARTGMKDRDLVLVEAVGADPQARTVRQRFGVPDGEFRAILVGKDGGAKLASGSPIPVERLFGEIDAMPMRQDEMRRSGSQVR